MAQTAEQLIKGLRSKGHSILRSIEPNWVIIPRLDRECEEAAWLGRNGARLTLYEPERWTDPKLRVYEADVTSVKVVVPEIEGEPEMETKIRMRRAIWEAAARAR